MVRTHHITSKKKLNRVKWAAEQHDVDFLMVRSGSYPGLMFAEDRKSVV